MSKKREKSQKQGGRYAFTARALCYIAVATALLCVCAWIALPLGDIPFTLQTLGVFLIGGLLGWKRAILAVTAYLLLGFVGVPVFAGFTGGAGKILSPTGGYLVGFLCTGLVCGVAGELFAEKKGGRATLALGVGMFLGLLLCYAFGTLWFLLLTAQGQGVSVWTALTLCVFPYLPLDLVKIFPAVVLTKKLRLLMKGLRQ